VLPLQRKKQQIIRKIKRIVPFVEKNVLFAEKILVGAISAVPLQQLK